MIEPNITEPTYVLKSDAFRYIVYAWIRGSECFYVGCSRSGILRFQQGHQISTYIEEGEEIHIWTMPDKKSMFHLESKLIFEWKPRFNRNPAIEKKIKSRERAKQRWKRDKEIAEFLKTLNSK
jgi:hypothetical protein